MSIRMGIKSDMDITCQICPLSNDWGYRSVCWCIILNVMGKFVITVLIGYEALLPFYQRTQCTCTSYMLAILVDACVAGF